MQLPRLDPLANSGPHQRLLKNAAKSFTLSEAQYDLLSEGRPGLITTEGDAGVVGYPYRDFLRIHYAYPTGDMFHENFIDAYLSCTEASSKQEAPRGVELAFRDRSNRALADTLFWSLGFDDANEWVEMNLGSVPEQPEPSDDLGNGYTLREATAADQEDISSLEQGTLGLPPLSQTGMESLLADTACLRIIEKGGAAPGYLSLRTEPGGWGIIEELIIAPEAAEATQSALAWAIAWLRNHRSRRIRRIAILGSPEIASLREAGFTPGETGVTFVQPVERNDVEAKIAERKAHGTRIKFGSWR